MIRSRLLAVAGVLVAVVAQAAPTRTVDLHGPSSVFVGEEAVFYSTAKDASLELRSLDADGSVQTWSGSHAFSKPGRYTIQLATDGLQAKPLRLEVKALPPPVTPDMPLEKRLAEIQIVHVNEDGYLWERIEERTVPAHLRYASKGLYAVEWPLVGQQATRANVGYAIDELARRGYVLDVYANVHGYPLELADGDWTNIGSNPGLKSVRLFFSFACHGAEGAKAFLAAGVQTYVGAPGLVGAVPDLLLPRFLAAWRKGRTAAEANDHAFAIIEEAAHAPLIGRVIELLTKKYIEGTLHKKWPGFEAALQGTRFQVFGDARATRATDLTNRSGIVKNIAR